MSTETIDITEMQGPPMDDAEAELVKDADYFRQQYGDHFEKLPDQLVKAFRSVTREFQEQNPFSRRREAMRDRKNRFYERSVQHLWESRNGFSQITPGMTYTQGNQKLQAPNYVDDYNIFLPGGRALQAALTQNPPGIEFRPDDEDSTEDNEAADAAQDSTLVFDRSNDIKGLQLKQVRMYLLSGRTVSWTRTEKNAELWGVNDDGTPRSRETTTFYGTLETKVPITAECQKDCLYLSILDDPDVKKVKSDYRGLKDYSGAPISKKIEPGKATPGESEWERIARLGILQGTRATSATGETFTHLAGRCRIWLRPDSFTGDLFDEPFDQAEGDDVKEDENGMQKSISVGEKLRQIFSAGARVTWVGEVYCGSKPESMDDHIDISFPYEGDGMSRQAILDSFVVIQDTFNDVQNAFRQAVDTGWPSRWVDAEEEDAEAVASQIAVPYAIRGRKARTNMPLEANFYQEPDINIPASVVEWIDNMIGPLAQYMLATPPALFGAGDKDQKTSSGIAQLRAQALGQLGLFWAAMQRQWARIRYQAALAAADNPDYREQILVPGADPEQSRFRKISKGHFGAFPDEDSSFPESTDQKRAVLQAILELALKSPQIGLQILGSPKNWGSFLALNGLPEIEIPEADAYEKQQYEIEELLKASPTTSDEAMQAAQQQYIQAVMQARQSALAAGALAPQIPPFDPMSVPPDTPTIPVQELDFHQWEFESCREWLSSQECRDEEANGNLGGIMNVRLHALAHLKAMATAPQPLTSEVLPTLTPGGPPPPVPSNSAPPPTPQPALPPSPVLGAPVGG